MRLSNVVLLVSVFSIFISGCEKNNEDPVNQIVGTWNQVSTKIIRYYDNVRQSETNNTYDPGELVTEIYDDGTAKKFIDGVISDEFYWEIDGDLLIMTNGYGVVLKAQFSVDKNTLVLKWANEDTVDGHLIRFEYESVYSRAVV